MHWGEWREIKVSRERKVLNRGIAGNFQRLRTPNLTSRQLDKWHYNTVIFHDFFNCDGHDQAISFE